MIAAGKDEIRKWFLEGVEDEQKYMLVVYDRMDYPDNPDSPYYADDAESAWDLLREFGHSEMCEVMEVYDLGEDMEAQLAEERAWHTPPPPESEEEIVLPANGNLSSGETRLEFMRTKNEEFIREYFDEPEEVLQHAVLVFTDETREFVSETCVYILEKGWYADRTVAAVYRFDREGGAKAYDVLLVEQPDDAKNLLPVNFPLTQHYEASVDGPYLNICLCYVTGKDKYSSAYKQWSHSETRLFMKNSDCYGSDSLTGGPSKDYGSHESYLSALELIEGGRERKALKLLREAAAEGHGEAAFTLGKMLFDSIPGRRENAELEKEAANYYKTAAYLGHAEAMFELAMCYAIGRGVQHDSRESYEWTLKSAALNFPKAVCMVGFHYETGSNEEKDEKEAVTWYLRAAELGEADAMYSLATCYRYGIGVEEDPEESLRWLRLAAENGDERAMYEINPPEQRYEWVKSSADERSAAADDWQIFLEGYRKKQDHVYHDDIEEEWVDSFDLKLGGEMSLGNVLVEVTALLFEKGVFAGAALDIKEPAGGLSTVVDEERAILVPGKKVHTGYSTGNDDFSVSYSYLLSLRKRLK